MFALLLALFEVRVGVLGSIDTMRLPAEWERQELVILVLPNSQNQDIVGFGAHLEMCRAILAKQRLLLVAENEACLDRFTSLLGPLAESAALQFHLFDCDDLWVRDFGPLTVQARTGEFCFQDFRFNGWGSKYSFRKSNAFNESLQGINPFASMSVFQQEGFVLEGGSIDCNGSGALLLTENCLLNQNRNPSFSRAQIEQYLQKSLGISQFLWLSKGSLPGDDTDCHIDNLARFVSKETIFYAKASPEDDLWPELQEMEQELASYAGYEMIPIALPAPVLDLESGERLPASYLNFLIINEAVLIPSYGQLVLEAEIALLFQKYLPSREIVWIDSRALIRGRGGVHCASMQVPKSDKAGL